MSKKSKKKEKIKSPKQWNNFYKSLIVAGGVGAATLIGYFGTNAYLDSKLSEREKQFLVSLKGTPQTKVNLDHPFFDKFIWVWRLHELEDKASRSIDDLITFIEKEKSSLGEMTSSPYERQGMLEKTTKGIKVVYRDQWKAPTIQYLTEMSQGNLQHKKELLEIYKQNKEVFDQAFMFYAVPFILDLMEGYKAGLMLPVEKRKEYRVKIWSDEGEKAFEMDELKITWEKGINFFTIAAEYFNGVSPSFLNTNDLKNYDLFARFHTHPKEDVNYFPSDADLSNTHLHGPNVLFSQTNGTLHVYLINKGTSREIYTGPIK